MRILPDVGGDGPNYVAAAILFLGINSVIVAGPWFSAVSVPVGAIAAWYLFLRED